MRVKKLNVNRRAKSSDESGAQSPQHERTSSSDWSSASSPERPSVKGSLGVPPRQLTSPVQSLAQSSKRFATRPIVESPTDSTVIPRHAAAGITELDLARQVARMDDVHMDEESSSETHSEAASTSWRDRVEHAVRDAIHQKIVAYLKALKPHAPAKVLEKLPGLAYRMEQTLWSLATSEQEYADEGTLVQRLTMIQQLNAKRLLEQHVQVSAPAKVEARLPAGLGVQNRQPLTEEQARMVFSCLQSWRQRMVNLYGVTPSEVSTNETLAKLSVFVPSSQQDLLACGITIEQSERFGPSLLQEMQKIVNALISTAASSSASSSRSSSPSGFKRASPGGSRSSRPSKRDEQGAKKRKTSNEAASTEAPTLPAGLMNAAMRLNQASFLSPSSIMSSVALLARASDAALPASTLPVLLPSATLGRNSFGLSSSASSRVSPNGQATSLFPRFPVAGDNAENRIHLLAHEAGKQEEHALMDAKAREVFEQEIHSLRRLLEESEHKRVALEAEVRELRQQRQLSTSNVTQ